MDNYRQLRNRGDDGRLAVDGLGVDRAHSPDTLLGMVVDGGSKPSSAPGVFLVDVTRADFDEVEGATVTLTTFGRTRPVLVTDAVPANGAMLLASKYRRRWVARNAGGPAPSGPTCGPLGTLATTLYCQDSNLPGTRTLVYRPAFRDWFGGCPFGSAKNVTPFPPIGSRSGSCSGALPPGSWPAIGWLNLSCGLSPTIQGLYAYCLCGAFTCPPAGATFLSGSYGNGAFGFDGQPIGGIFSAGPVTVVSTGPLLATFPYTAGAGTPSWVYGSDGPVSGTLTLFE